MIDNIFELLINDLKYPTQTVSKNIKIGGITFDYGIFKKDKPHTIDNIIVAIDNKHSDINEFKDKVTQLAKKTESLKYAMFDSTDADVRYYKVNSKKQIIDYINLPSFNTEEKFLTKYDLVKATNFEKILRGIHNYIYANDGLNPNQVFDEIIKVLFIKLEDEKKNKNEQLDFYIDTNEYEYIFESGKEKNLLFVERINNIFEKIKNENKTLFHQDDKIKLKNKTLAYVVGQLEYYSLNDLDYDIKGVVFQSIIDTNQKGGRGQFFTPQAVVKFMISMIDPDIDSKYADPSCGTGGFLREVVSYIVNKFDCKDYDINEFIENNIHGIEINPDIARVAKMRFLFENGTINNNILCADTLAIDNEKLIESYDFIITNPPFGTQGKVIDKSILIRYDLGHTWKNNEITDKVAKGQVPDILFIEKCLKMLKNKGVLAIVLPNGDLENPSLSYLREYILRNGKLLASIKLPDETFVPYGTGVKSSILFIKKLDEKELNIEKEKDYNIFFGEITKLGYSFSKSSKPVYKTDDKGENLLDFEGKYIIDEDFTDIVENYKIFIGNDHNIKSKNCFTVKYSELENRFDYSFYKPEFIENINKLKQYNSVPLNSVVDIVKKSSEILKNKEEDVKYIEISNINTHSTEIVGYNEMKVKDLPSRAKYEIKAGNIITSIAGNAIGTNKHATAYVTDEYDGCICTNGLRVLQAKNIHPLYLLYYLRTSYFLDQVMKYRTGAAIPNISDDDFSKILIYIPEEDELKEIIESVEASFEMREKAKQLLNKKIINI